MSTPPKEEGLEILIVDDQPANLKVLSLLLVSHGYQTLPAISGELALAAVRARPPALILLDIRMPDMNGFEVCRRLKENPATRDIPVVFLSALDQTEDKVQAFAVGGVDYITKPFQTEEVLARIRTHMRVREMQRELARQNQLLRTELEAHQRTQAQLRATNQIQEVLLNAPRDCIVLLDGEGRVLRANRAMREGFPDDEAGIFWKALPPRIATEYQQAATRAMTEGEPTRLETHHEGRWWDHLFYPVPEIRPGASGVAIFSHDITARKSMEERLRMALEAAEDGLWDVRLENGSLLQGEAYFSPRYLAILGYQPDELSETIQTWADRVHPADIARVAALIQAHARGDDPIYQAEYRMRHKDGRWIWVQARGKVVEFDDQHRPARAIGTLWDCTRGKQAELRLRREIELNATLAELSQALLATSPLNETLRLIAHRAKRLTASEAGVAGYLSRETQELICPREHGEAALRLGVFRGLWGEVLATREPMRLNQLQPEFAADAVPGDPRPARNFLAVPVEQDHQRLGILALANRDGEYSPEDLALLQRLAFFCALAIRRHHDEQALRISESRLREAQQLAQMGGWTWDAVGDHLECSPEMLRILVWDQPPKRLADWLERIHPMDRPTVAGLFHQSRVRAEAMACDYRVLCPDGEARTLHCKADAVRDASGGLIRLNGFVQDITRVKQAEEVLRRDQEQLEQRVVERTLELEQANLRLRDLARMKDEFLAGMSHELRSPLNAILAGAEMLDEEIYGPLNPRQRKSVGRMTESGRHLLDLISDILDVSKIGAGKLELHFEEVDPRQICDSAVALISDSATRKFLRVETQYDPRADKMRADPRRFKQVLINLLNNAVKFTPAHGTIGLILEADPEQHQLRFRVWDTGIGIDPDRFERLFEPFVQLDSSLSREFEGTGLGLALVRKLTDMHGGGVGVESQPDQGATFTVAVPWHGEPAENPASARETEAATARVLIAEDNADNRHLLVEYLRAKGYRILEALDGAQAIRLARDERPDIILMDIQMPGIDGIDATRRIREMSDLAHVPIIALTALAMPGDRERCLVAGMDAYLTKPVAIRELVKLIQQLLARKSPLSSSSE